LVTGPLGSVAGEPDRRQRQLLCLIPAQAAGAWHVRWRVCSAHFKATGKGGGGVNKNHGSDVHLPQRYKLPKKVAACSILFLFFRRFFQFSTSFWAFRNNKGQGMPQGELKKHEGFVFRKSP
jgi:hypothetical protein